ncbi:MAG: ACT domain-containing protein [Armatimonadetes bacterium]|nr:ACT domain-containing protein [Anaerolineae bacterium]
MSEPITHYLAQMVIQVDNEPYLLIKLPPAAILVAAAIIAEISDPFCALIIDKHEVTLVVPYEAPEEFAARLHGHEISAARYRLITLDVVLPPDLVGFMAQISAALAAAGVPIFPYAAYSRDHILVAETHLTTALDTLQHLKGS